MGRRRSGKSGGERGRRFSEEQIKSLESMFEEQAKLEPRQKLELARELGLQPRQVAIWFQNKRARWKSKQLQREYCAFKADYDALLSSFHSLNKEKLILLAQLQELAELLDKTEKRSNRDDDHDDGGSNKKEQRRKLPLKKEHELELTVGADEEDERLYGSKQPPTSSPAHQFYFATNWPSDHTWSNSQWWEFWPLSE